MRSVPPLTSPLLILLALLLLASAPSALAQEMEWEYLVVSYGTTLFSSPIILDF